MLGGTDADRAALEALNLLAAETSAEIQGLFVEDSELLDLAGLPAAREFCRLTHRERQLQAADLERQFRIQARIAEQALAAIAGRTGQAWSFRTVRGVLVTLLLETIKEMDLMLLGATRRTLPLPGRPVPATLSRPACRPVTTVFDGSAAASRALGVAVRLAKAGGQALTVLLVADNPDKLELLQGQATAELGAHPARFHGLVDPGLHELLTAVRGERAGALVLGLSERLLSQETIELLRNRLSCPAILVK